MKKINLSSMSESQKYGLWVIIKECKVRIKNSGFRATQERVAKMLTNLGYVNSQGNPISQSCVSRYEYELEKFVRSFKDKPVMPDSVPHSSPVFDVPAYPVAAPTAHSFGLTKREVFVLHALVALNPKMINVHQSNMPQVYAKYATNAVLLADCVLKQIEGK